MNSPRILIVDDDPEFLRALSAVLAAAGFEAITAVDVKSAQPILSRPDPGIDLLIVDLVLQGELSGFDLISIVTRTRPSFRILAASGVYRRSTLEYIADRMGADTFIEKPKPGEPLDGDQWVRAIQRLLKWEPAEGQRASEDAEAECAERLALGRALSRAIIRVHNARTDYDSAKASKAGQERLGALLDELHAARADELKAEHSHREHVEHHRCQKPRTGKTDREPAESNP